MLTAYTEASISGTGVYILKLHRPLCHAKFYVGYSVNVQGRLHYHRTGRGSKFTQALYREGITFEVVAFIPSGNRAMERHIKNQHNTARWLERHRHDPKVMVLRGYDNNIFRELIWQRLAA